MRGENNWEPVEAGALRRMRRVAWVFVLLMAAVLAQASWVQVWNRDAILKDRPETRRRTDLFARRGMLLDRNRNVLAMDRPTYCLAADLSVMGDVRRAARLIGGVLGCDRGRFTDLLWRHRKEAYFVIQRRITEAERTALLDTGLFGLIINPSRERVRPAGGLALPVLGLTNAEHRGVAGVEQQMESALAGEDGFTLMQVDGRNRVYAAPGDPDRPPVDGNDVVLTLDQTTQTILEEELGKGLRSFRAAFGSGVLMDPYTGEILAMASLCASPPSDSSGSLLARAQNRAVQTVFEPGSTMKIVTAAAALESGLFSPATAIDCEGGAYRFAGRVIHDHEKRYGLLTFGAVIEVSSNIGITKVSKKIGRKRLAAALQDFGIGTRTAVDLPGEAPGFVPPLYEWNDFMTAAIGFGQGLSVTTLQTACMAAAVANGGELVKPRIVRAVIGRNGETLAETRKETIRRVMPASVAAQLADILEGAVVRGSGREAAVEGLRVAGKTGTAQKSGPGGGGYEPGLYNASFVGFWPKEAPRYVLAVVLEEPRESYWASRSAAPVFSRVVERLAGLPSAPWLRRDPDPGPGPDDAPRFILSAARNGGAEAPATPRPAAGAAPLDRVPPLVGLSLREALIELAKRKVEARVQGEGVVVRQSPEPGSPLGARTVCFLACAGPDRREETR